jgi:hypothetical protein
MTLRRLVEAGRLRVLQAVPSRPRFDRLELDAFLQGRGAAAANSRRAKGVKRGLALLARLIRRAEGLRQALTTGEWGPDDREPGERRLDAADEAALVASVLDALEVLEQDATDAKSWAFEHFQTRGEHHALRWPPRHGTDPRGDGH